MYDLGFTVPVDGVREVPAGTSILVAGPPTVEKAELAYELLAAGQRRGDGAILVTTREVGELARASYEGVAGESMDEGTFRVVDASPYSDGDDAGPGVAVADDPADLTGIGRAMARSREPVEEAGVGGVRVAFDSVSTMLEHLDEKSVYKFLRTLDARVDATDSLGIVTLDAVEDHERRRGMLLDAFDAAVEFREADTGREVRAVGFAGVPATWTEC